MTWLYLLSGATTVGLFAYLVYVLIRPEEF